MRCLLFLLLPCCLFAELHTLTYASDWRPELKALVRSGKKHGIDIITHGLDRKFTSTSLKIVGVKEFIEKRNLPESDLLLFVDAYDVIILDHKRKILDAFDRIDAEIVFSAEKSCWPLQSLAQFYPKSPTEHRYLNAGGFIGRVGAIKKMLETINPNDREDDQLLYTTYFLFFKHGIKLDTRCEIFLPLQLVGDNELEPLRKGRKIRYKKTGTIPPIIHGNGDGKKQYRQITRWHIPGNLSVKDR